MKNFNLKRKIVLNFYVITMSTYGVGLSGGDRIWIELCKRLGIKYKVTVFAWEEGIKIAEREGLKNVNFILWSAALFAKSGFFMNYFARIVIGLIKASKLHLTNSGNEIIYSASEFWQDILPVAILKIRYPKVKWVAAWYQTAPNPFRGYSEGERSNTYKINAFLYWFAQLFSKPIISHFADKVVVNNETEKEQFPDINKRGDVFIMHGAVNLEDIEKWKMENGKFPKMYDGVFQGRFHPQKGVVELVDIWKKVTDKIPNAKLAMIGDGPLMEKVKSQITKRKLQNNIKLFGYVFDGPEKYKIFSQSKVVVHPSFYDSGGMASAEAMAFGIPCVGFKLKSYDFYYPKGMVKVSVGDKVAFSGAILKFLNDGKSRIRIGTEAFNMIASNWSWEKRTDEFLKHLV